MAVMACTLRGGAVFISGDGGGGGVGGDIGVGSGRPLKRDVAWRKWRGK